MNRLRAAAAAFVVAAAALAAAAPASADNSNSNTNNNDVTNQGGDGADTSSSSESTAWPPTDLSWPPSAIMNGDKAENGSTAPPIVTPLGQPAPTETPAPDTQEKTKPIVPAG